MKINRSILKSTVVAGLLFSNSVFAYDEIMESTGLSQIKEVLQQDVKLNSRVDSQAINTAIASAERMNALIKEAIINEGLVNDGELSASDVREISRYLSSNYLNEWHQLRGDKNASTGYYAVEMKGADTIIFNKNAVNKVWGKIYDIGFAANKNRLSNYKSQNSIKINKVAHYLSNIMQDSIKDGSLLNKQYEEVKGDSGTNLDNLIEKMRNDEGLKRNVSANDIREGLKAANEMNKLIIEAIKAEGLANDNVLSTADIREINNYLTANHLGIWKELHGDDEKREETGFHLIQNDGATSRMFNSNVVNSIADGIYHLGFKTKQKNRLTNEDGNANKSFQQVAGWLAYILKDDLKANKLANNAYDEVTGTTNTTFDKIIPVIFNDKGLLEKVSTGDMREAAKSANKMNALLVEAIKETNSAEDGNISVEDTKNINTYLVKNHAREWKILHGDDEKNSETGFHLIQNDGAKTVIENRNLFNSLADSIYHLGFKTKFKNNLTNEDGNKNASFKKVAYWLNKYLQADIKKGLFK